ncbi:hypothetical protein [Yeosuana marina]|uniref:hypothetical protein n=1 Tax=Yeosuana marina TaxID=1565536 RepID=UPI0030C7B499
MTIQEYLSKITTLHQTGNAREHSYRGDLQNLLMNILPDVLVTNEIYKYYGFASSCIISMFTSLESFINHIIPNNKLYKKELHHKTEIYNKEQIQKGLSFDEKTKNVLPFFFENKNFFRH